MVAAARLMILNGMNAGYAAASVAADATTEAMAQVAFLAFGIALGVAHFRHLASAGPLTEAMVAMLLLAVPGIAALIFLQKKGADFAQKNRRRAFSRRSGAASRSATPSTSFMIRPARLAASAALHLLAWIGAGGGTFIAFRLVGGQVSLADAMALEALLCTLRSHRRLCARRARRAGSGLCHAGAAVRPARRDGAGGVAAQARAGDRDGRAGADLLAERWKAREARVAAGNAAAVSR